MAASSTHDLSKLFGSSLESHGTATDVSTLKDKVVALYFSAHWCPPCRAFTPTLIAAYNEAKKQQLPFELIFVSSDQDDEGFEEYYKDMPWLTVKYSDEDTRNAVSATFGVSGIPMLIVLGKDGKTITTDGRTPIAKNKVEAIKEWTA